MSDPGPVLRFIKVILKRELTEQEIAAVGEYTKERQMFSADQIIKELGL